MNFSFSLSFVLFCLRESRVVKRWWCKAMRFAIATRKSRRSNIIMNSRVRSLSMAQPERRAKTNRGRRRTMGGLTVLNMIRHKSDSGLTRTSVSYDSLFCTTFKDLINPSGALVGFSAFFCAAFLPHTCCVHGITSLTLRSWEWTLLPLSVTTRERRDFSGHWHWTDAQNENKFFHNSLTDQPIGPRSVVNQ